MREVLNSVQCWVANNHTWLNAGGYSRATTSSPKRVVVSLAAVGREVVWAEGLSEYLAGELESL